MSAVSLLCPPLSDAGVALLVQELAIVHRIIEARVKEVLCGRHTVNREQTVWYNVFTTMVRLPVLARPLPPRHIGSACTPVCRCVEPECAAGGAWHVQLNLRAHEPNIVLSVGTAFADVNHLTDDDRTLYAGVTLFSDDERFFETSRMTAINASSMLENWRVIDGLALGVVGVTPFSPKLEVLFVTNRQLIQDMATFVITHIFVCPDPKSKSGDLREMAVNWQEDNGAYVAEFPGRNKGRATSV